VRITDESIERIPVLESDVLSEEHRETLRNEQRELLRFIRGDDDGTEAVAYYTLTMERLNRYKGDPGAWQVFPTRYNIPHIAMHNHPAGGTFSLNDFHPFISNPNTKAMYAVGHDGVVYSLEKLPFCEAANAIHVFIDAAKNAPNPKENLNKFVDFIDEVYTAIHKFGFVYRKGLCL